MELQLKRSGISQTSFTKNPDLNWEVKNIKNTIWKNNGNFPALLDLLI